MARTSGTRGVSTRRRQSLPARHIRRGIGIRRAIASLSISASVAPFYARPIELLACRHAFEFQSGYALR